MNDVNKLAKALVESAEVRDKKKTSAYDTTARVVKVEGTTAWVAIPGGVDKTPARMAVNAKAGDDVRVRVAGGKAYVMGNTTAPPTDDALAKAAQDNAIRAAAAAEKASASAETAYTAANNALRDAATAQESADIAQTAANNAVEDAARAHAAADAAQEDADIAKTAADTAKESADQALWGLSTVEDVVGTLNWITAHGTMTLTSDTAINPAHVYFVVDADGDYEVGGTHYSIVTEPKVEELSTYYELTVDESLQNYVGTHLALTNEGLSVISTSQGWRVVIAAGGGTLFPNAGVYLVDPQGNIAQQTNANGVAFNTGKPVTIGDSTASIVFDGNGHIAVIGADLTIGGANNTSGVLQVKDSGGDEIGRWDKDGIVATRNDDIDTEIKISSDSTKSYALFKNDVTALEVSAFADGTVGLFELPYPFTTREPLLVRTGAAINMGSTLTVGYADNVTGVTISDAGTVTAWNYYAYIDTTAAAGTTDGDLYRAINALGWTSEVIE